MKEPFTRRTYAPVMGAYIPPFHFLPVGHRIILPLQGAGIEKDTFMVRTPLARGEFPLLRLVYQKTALFTSTIFTFFRDAPFLVHGANSGA